MREVSRVSGNGYSVGMFDAGMGTYAVQEKESAFLGSKVKRTAFDLDYTAARDLMEDWVSEGQREAMKHHRPGIQYLVVAL